MPNIKEDIGTSSNSDKIDFLENLVKRVNDKGHIAWPFPFRRTENSKYPVVKHNGKHISVMRYLCLLVHGNPPTGKPIAGNVCSGWTEDGRRCVAPSHVIWMSTKQMGKINNYWDKSPSGNNARHHNIKGNLTADTVKLLWQDLLDGMSNTDAATKHGITKNTVGLIKTKLAWRRVTDKLPPLEVKVRFTPEKVEDIWQRGLAGDSAYRIAKDIGVDSQTILNIFKGKTFGKLTKNWKRIPKYHS